MKHAFTKPRRSMPRRSTPRRSTPRASEPRPSGSGSRRRVNRSRTGAALWPTCVRRKP